MALLKDHQFNDLCKTLKISGLQPNDPDKKTIEKAFRRLALKTHPDKGGDPIEFKKINEAYNKLIGHVTKLDAIEAEAELSRTSVIIEISKHAVPKWKEKLKGAYGLPKTSKVNNVLFNGPYCHHKGKGKLTGPIVVVLYEDPEDKIPKIVCRCDNYMAWIQEQKMPLHLHVGREKAIMFDQWRIMSLAEFGFVSLTPGHSASYDMRGSNSEPNYKSEARRQKEEKERQEKAAQEEKARKIAEEKKRVEEEEAAKLAEEEKKKDEELSKLHQPWWQKYAEKYQGSAFEMSETTPPPEDDAFPQVYSMTSNAYTSGKTETTQQTKSEAEPKPEAEQPTRTSEKLSNSSEKLSNPTEKISTAEIPIPVEKELNSAEKPSTASPVVDEQVPEPSKKVAEPVVVPEVEIPVPSTMPIPPVAKSEPSSPPKPLKKQQPTEPEIQKAHPVINGETVAAAKTPEPSTSKEHQQQDEPVKPKSSEGKKPLSNIAEKMLSKSKVKKIKTKKVGGIKKAKPSTTASADANANAEDIIDSEEKENVDSSRRTSESNDPSIKMDDIKMSSTRKRPLEDIDVEGSKRSWENILHQMEQRNNEIMESVMEMKAAMADTCSKIHTLSL